MSKEELAKEVQARITAFQVSTLLGVRLSGILPF
jgi:hypothetical protein